MKKNFFRLIWRQITGNAGRFIAIFAITALGAGFLAGLQSTAPDMYKTVDSFYDDSGFADITIKSTGGLTDADILALESEEYISRATAFCTGDVLASNGSDEAYTTRVYGYSFDTLDTAVGAPVLAQGRLPENTGECLIEQSNGYFAVPDIGDTVYLHPDSDDDTYSVTEFKVTGIMKNPAYMSLEREPSSEGDGRVGMIVYVDRAVFPDEYFTDIQLTVSGAAALNAFESDYDDLISGVKEQLKGVAEIRTQLRYDELKGKAQEKIDEAYAEYNKKSDEVETELDNAAARLADARTKLDAARKTLDDKKILLNSAKAELDAQQESIAAAKAAVSAGLPVSDEIKAAISAYDRGVAEYEAGLTAYNSGNAELERSAAEYETSCSEYEVRRADALGELDRAKAEIDENAAKIAEIKVPEWYILDRDTNVTVVSFKANAEKIAAIARVFPLFFFLVAALVALTTMTRMVDEDRTEIGVLKALGYSKGAVYSKYLIYSALAAVLGSAAGITAGLIVLPKVIWNAYSIMYLYPSLNIYLNPLISLTTGAVTVLCVLAATIWACYENLALVPSRLMLPRAPKQGKRILLEYITPLWKRMKFTHKVTARNLFRYKKRFIMTIVGIAGCSALLLTAFGLRDSIGVFVDRQYYELQKYGLTVTIDAEKADFTALDAFLNDGSKAEDSLRVYEKTCTAGAGSKSAELTLTIPESAERLAEFTVLRTLRGHKPLALENGSVIITENFARTNGIGTGDTVTIETDDAGSVQVRVSGICENYIGNMLYMTPETYESLYGLKPEYSTYLIKSAADGAEQENAAVTQLLGIDGVSGASFTSGVSETFSNMVDKIDYIVVVLIISAGLLAFVVLYNLTNINISEREKEIATIKVLGFRDREVSQYIYRETVILSIIGTALGLVLGIFLHMFVVHTAEMDNIMFGHDIFALSFVYSAAISLFFTLCVNFVMSYKLKKIDMVESMKSVD